MHYKFALSVTLVAICASPLLAQSRAKDGAVAGGVAGAIIGGIAGHQNDETPEGIAIGGAVGAIAGGLLGHAHDQHAQRNYHYQGQPQLGWRRPSQPTYRYQPAVEVHRPVPVQTVSQGVSLNDAITMSRNGISPNLIVNQVRTSGVQQKIGVQEIITLHQSGVSESVIEEMQSARVNGVSTTPAVIIDRRPEVIVESCPNHYCEPPARHARNQYYYRYR